MQGLGKARPGKIPVGKMSEKQILGPWQNLALSCHALPPLSF